MTVQRGGAQRQARLSAQNSSFINAVEAGAFSSKLRFARQPDYNRMFMALLFCLFVVCLLLAVVVGVHTYSTVSADQAKGNASRLATSFLVNDIRANDALDAVATGTGPEGPSLVLIERLENATYETRLYLYKNNIVQEYTKAGSPYAPAQATPVVASRMFHFEYADGLLTLVTDQGTSKVALRSVKGA